MGRLNCQRESFFEHDPIRIHLRERWSNKQLFGGGNSKIFLIFTPPKFNIAPENWCLEDEFLFGIAYF